MQTDLFLTRNLDRRDFIISCAKSACAAGLAGFVLREANLFASTDSAGSILSGGSSGGDDRFIKEARHYTKLGDNLVQCGLCPHHCPVPAGARGRCGVRENRNGTYYTLVHSRVCALHTDPIEKKPLFHYMPGKNAVSLATPGCNFSCKFCQNWQISQAKPEEIYCQYVTPENIVQEAVNSKTPCIAYTYSEPTIFYEFMYDVAKLGNERGIKSVMISNGFMEDKPQAELLEQLDAVKVDFKGFSDDYYQNICGGTLKGVQDSIKRIRAKGKWLELVVLVVPTLNDSSDEITAMASWIAGELGDEVPVHFSRFHPEYKLKNLPITPVETLDRCVEICKNKGLKYVYVGNLAGHPAENTYCPSCTKVVIRRYGLYVLSIDIKDGKCAFCGHKIAGVFASGRN